MPGFPDRFICKATAVPEDLTGKSVLDVGGYDGKMASLCMGRGAKSATVVDSEQFIQYEGYAIKDFPENVSFVACDIMDYPIATGDDLVVCFDVLYHVRDPLGFLARLRELTGEAMCFSTRTVDGPKGYWRLLEPYEQHPDPTVVWKPTLSGLLKMLGMVGFQQQQVTYREDPGTFEPDGLIVLRCS